MGARLQSASWFSSPMSWSRASILFLSYAWRNCVLCPLWGLGSTALSQFYALPLAPAIHVPTASCIRWTTALFTCSSLEPTRRSPSFCLRGALGWTLFGIVWGCALVGVIVKAFAAGRWGIVSTAMYLAMGWACIFAVPMYHLIARPAFILLFAGGLCYSGGIPFYASPRKYMHFLWHLWVLAGTACHFAATWLLVG